MRDGRLWDRWDGRLWDDKVFFFVRDWQSTISQSTIYHLSSHLISDKFISSIEEDEEWDDEWDGGFWLLLIFFFFFSSSNNIKIKFMKNNYMIENHHLFHLIYHLIYHLTTYHHHHHFLINEIEISLKRRLVDLLLTIRWDGRSWDGKWEMRWLMVRW